jgi:hypothetical protein
MKLGMKIFLATALAAVLVVPAAGAKPGNGNGNGGGGKPSWAGQPASQGGNGGGKANAGAKAKGKPAWAGQGQAKKAEQAQRKLERRAAKGRADEEGDEGEELEAPLKDNPAFICKFERDMMGAEAFADAHGTNDNQANAFGKCVSEEAQARDGAEGAEEEPAEAPAACEPVEGEEPVEDGTEDSETPAADDPAEDECPDEDADSTADAEDGETGEDSEDGVEDDGSSVDEILAALRLLL